MIVAIYDTATGQIRCTLEATQEIVELNVGEGEAYIQAVADDTQHYVDNGALVDIPQPPHELATWNWQTKLWDMPTEQAMYDHYAAEATELRNQLLTDSDWSQLPDVPDIIKAAYADYRQALRDLTNQEGYPFEITWPTQPEV